MEELLSKPITQLLIGAFIVVFPLWKFGNDDNADAMLSSLIIVGIISFFIAPGVTIGMMFGFVIAFALA